MNPDLYPDQIKMNRTRNTVKYLHVETAGVYRIVFHRSEKNSLEATKQIITIHKKLKQEIIHVQSVQKFINKKVSFVAGLQG